MNKLIRRLFRRPKRMSYADRIQEEAKRLSALNDDEWEQAMFAFSDQIWDGK